MGNIVAQVKDEDVGPFCRPTEQVTIAMWGKPGTETVQLVSVAVDARLNSENRKSKADHIVEEYNLSSL